MSVLLFRSGGAKMPSEPLCSGKSRGFVDACGFLPSKDRIIHKGDVRESCVTWKFSKLRAGVAKEVRNECDKGRRGRILPSKQENRQQQKAVSSSCTGRSKCVETERKDHGRVQLKDAVNALDCSGIQADLAAYACLLQSCGVAKALSQGKRVHAHIIKTGHERDMYFGNLLVQMYGKCGALEDAREVFAKMHQRNVVSWTTMIGAYAQHGRGKEALLLFQQMQLEGVMPNKVTFVSILDVCASQASLAEGRRMHGQIVRDGFESDVVVGTALVNMYGKCGSVEDALKTFDKMPERNVVSWTAMIGVYAKHGQGKRALQLFRQMQLEGFMPTKVTFINTLSACASQAILAEGKLMHARIVESSFESDVVVGNALINMYGKCASLEDARRVFDKMPERDVFSWTSIIAAYAQHSQGKEALQLFQQMQLEGVIPNKVTFVSILDACASQVALAEGKLIHVLIMGYGLESNVIVGTALINMYGKCGCLGDARRIFDKMPKRDVVAWNAMIAAYAQHEQGKEALQLLQLMQLGGVIPDKFTFVSLLDACASQATLSEGKRMHAHIVGGGFESSLVVSNALVNMYGKCGSLEDARRIFDRMFERDLISWNAMIAAYAQHGQGKEALQLFRRMHQEGIIPDKITFISALSATASQAALADGKQMHARILDMRLDSDVVIGSALVNMYAKCGSLEDARKMFDSMPERNVVSWNAMIAAYAQHGQGMGVVQLFQQMQLEGVIPSQVTFLSILSVCSHTGLVDEGYNYLVSMSRDHGVTPTLEHYNCMLDILGRAGQLDEGEDMLINMPFKPTATSWMTLLGACRMHFDVKRGKRAAEHVFVLDPENSASYVLLTNIYAAAGMWDDATRVRKVMEEKGLKKQPGCSSIEIKNKVYEFYVGDESHPQQDEICVLLQRLNRQMEEVGYVPDMNMVLHDVDEEEKEHMLRYHSEKLAIAFGLMSTPPGTPLCIIKNLRMCSDCHSVTKFISKIAYREIIVRDANRFHHIRDGVCSCVDY